MALPKRYETVARLGASVEHRRHRGRDHARPAGCRADPPELPTGEMRQRPPIYSAVKIGGERAYQRARRGERFEMPERIVTVYRFEQLWREQEPAPGELPRAAFEIECGSGTYVRSLIADLGDAYCLELRRTAIGPFDVRDAVAPPARGEPWREPPLIALDRALASLLHNRLCGREGHSPARRRARNRAQRRGGHLRRRAPRPPRGDRGLRQRAHVRPPPRVGGRARSTRPSC